MAALGAQAVQLADITHPSNRQHAALLAEPAHPARVRAAQLAQRRQCLPDILQGVRLGRPEQFAQLFAACLPF